MGILEALIAIFGGGATGLFGSLLNRGMGFLETRQKFSHELKLHELNLQARGQEMEHEAAIAEVRALADMRAGSYQHDMAADQASPWVHNVLRLVRPTLTAFLIVLVFVIWWSLTPAEAGMRLQIVNSVLYLAAMAVAWWFGDRAPSNRQRLPWRG